MSPSPDDETRLAERIARLERELADSRAARSFAERELRRLRNLPAWAFRAVHLSARLRRSFAPPGSQRERWVEAAWARSRRKRLKAPAPRSSTALRSPCSGFGGEPGLVSVVLPVYNQASMLGDSIRSVLNQSYRHLELIVVNDGSKDDAETVMAEFVGDRRVRLLTQRNQKLPKALSNGFEFANGEFWTWTSADNLMAPDHLARLVEHLRSRPGTPMAFANYWAIDDRGAILTDPSFRPHNRPDMNSGAIVLPKSTAELNTVQDNFIGPCFMYRGWIGKMVGEYDPGLLGVEDYDYWMRINAYRPIERLESDEPLYWYRVHDNSLSGQAVSLGIHQRARWIIDHEARRAEFRARPWTIHLDPALGWDLDEADIAPHRLRVAEPDAPALDSGKTLRIVRGPRRSPQSPNCPEESGRELVAIWHDDPAAAYDAVPCPDVLALAADDKMARRLAVVGAFGLVTNNPQDAVALATAWADGVEFDRRDPQRRESQREIPKISGVGDRLPTVRFLDDQARQAWNAVVSPNSAQEWRAGQPDADILCAAWPDCANSLADQSGKAPVIGVLSGEHGDCESNLGISVTNSAITAYLCANRTIARAADLQWGLPPSRLLIASDFNPNGLAQALIWLVRGGPAASARGWAARP